MSTLTSFTSSLMLHKIRDYAELYKISKKWLCIKTEPIVHRSLLFSTVEKEDSSFLENLLIGGNRKTTEEYVNRPNHKGQFALQMSMDSENAKCVALLLQAGAKVHQEKYEKLPALRRLLRPDQTSGEYDGASNAIARMTIDNVRSVQEGDEAYEQLTKTPGHGVGKCFFTQMEVNQFARISVWNKWKTLQYLHLIKQECLEWVIQQAKEGHWDKDQVVDAMSLNDEAVILKLPLDQQLDVLEWDKGSSLRGPIKHTALKEIHLLDEEHLTLLIQQSIMGKWDKTDVYSALIAKNENEEASFQKISSPEGLAGFAILCQLSVGGDENLFCQRC